MRRGRPSLRRNAIPRVTRGALAMGLLSVLVVLAMVAVAVVSRQAADSHRRAQVLAEQLRASSQEMSALKWRANTQVLSGTADFSTTGSLVSAGARILAQLHAEVTEFRRAQPGADTQRLWDDVQELIAGSVQRSRRRQRRQSQVPATLTQMQKQFQPILDRMDVDAQRAAQHQQAVATAGPREPAVGVDRFAAAGSVPAGGTLVAPGEPSPAHRAGRGGARRRAPQRAADPRARRALQRRRHTAGARLARALAGRIGARPAGDRARLAGRHADHIDCAPRGSDVARELPASEARRRGAGEPSRSPPPRRRPLGSRRDRRRRTGLRIPRSMGSCSTCATSASGLRSRTNCATKRSATRSQGWPTARCSKTGCDTRWQPDFAPSGHWRCCSSTSMTSRRSTTVSGTVSVICLLERVAARIDPLVRPSDTAARLGGDEFAVLLDGVDSVDEAEEIADRILAAVGETVADRRPRAERHGVDRDRTQRRLDRGGRGAAQRRHGDVRREGERQELGPRHSSRRCTAPPWSASSLRTELPRAL